MKVKKKKQRKVELMSDTGQNVENFKLTTKQLAPIFKDI